MDYRRHYDRLIERARERSTLVGYFERHHIIPRCLGGSDDPSNIVRLTAEEHFVAHQMLVKMHPGHIGLVWAANAMANGSGRQQRNNKSYAWLRHRLARQLRELFAGKPLSAEHRQKLSEAAKRRVRRPHSEETRARISAATKGRERSLRHCAALSASHLGKKGARRSPEARARMSVAQKAAAKRRDFSFTQTPSYRSAQSVRMKQIWAGRKAAVGEV